MPAEGESAVASRFAAFTADQAVAFASLAIAETRTTTIDAARGTLAAWKEAAGKTAALATELADKSARLATIERERLLERAVAEGRLAPSEAWSFSVDTGGNKVRSFSAWAGPPYQGADPKLMGTGQSLEQLAAFVAQRAPGAAPARALTPAPAKKAAPAGAPPAGVKPESFAAAAAQVAELLGAE
jgi:hypothetical protein